MEWRMVGPRLPDSNPLPVMRNIKIINVSDDAQPVASDALNAYQQTWISIHQLSFVTASGIAP